jgi:tRNA(His) guanylyltransferase
MKDPLGDRMKDLEKRTQAHLPRRTYTLIRLDGKAFHTYTKGAERPFDHDISEAMIQTTKYLCHNIQGCKIGYTQSDEISLLLTDFDDIATDAWYDGNIQKIVSISASAASAFFNEFTSSCPDKPFASRLAVFDSRVWSTADPWEVFNTCCWRQKDATRNAIQMAARCLESHKKLQGKSTTDLLELIKDKGVVYDDYPSQFRKGAFFFRVEGGWEEDRDPKILGLDQGYFFDHLPLIPQDVPRSQ